MHPTVSKVPLFCCVILNEVLSLLQAVPVYGVFTDHEAELGKVNKPIV